MRPLAEEQRGRWVIPAGQEIILKDALLLSESARAAHLEFVDAIIERSTVRARYRVVDEVITVVLARPDAPTFATPLTVISVSPASQDLSDALARALSTLTGRFVWVHVEDGPKDATRGERTGERTGDVRGEAFDTELLAVRIGIKPAIRSMAAVAELDAMRARLEAAGLVVERRDRVALEEGVLSDVLCASMDGVRARELIAAERALYAAHVRMVALGGVQPLLVSSSFWRMPRARIFL